MNPAASASSPASGRSGGRNAPRQRRTTGSSGWSIGRARAADSRARAPSSQSLPSPSGSARRRRRNATAWAKCVNAVSSSDSSAVSLSSTSLASAIAVSTDSTVGGAVSGSSNSAAVRQVRRPSRESDATRDCSNSACTGCGGTSAGASARATAGLSSAASSTMITGTSSGRTFRTPAPDSIALRIRLEKPAPPLAIRAWSSVNRANRFCIEDRSSGRSPSPSMAFIKSHSCSSRSAISETSADTPSVSHTVCSSSSARSMSGSAAGERRPDSRSAGVWVTMPVSWFCAPVKSSIASTRRRIAR